MILSFQKKFGMQRKLKSQRLYPIAEIFRIKCGPVF